MHPGAAPLRTSSWPQEAAWIMPPHPPMTTQADAPLRIALGNETDGPGGVETLLVQLAVELRNRGHEVVPLLPVERENWLHGAMQAEGFTPVVVDFRGLSAGGIVRRTREVLRGSRIDVLHSHEFTMSVFGAAAARMVRIPHVISMHGNQTMTATLRRRMALRWAFRQSAAVVAVSSDTRKHLETTLGIREGRILTVRNGIPLRPGRGEPIRREFGLGETDVMLLSVGNLSERKGHAVLVKALAHLRNDGLESGWSLVIAGRGSQREPLEALIAETGLEGRVHLAGHRDDIPDLQEAADLFVMPSLWEGLPLAVLEAMFAGNPVVASLASGIPEAMDDGVEGRLVPPGDPAVLAEALAPLLRDGNLRRKMGEAARTRAHRDFTVERMASDYEALYRGRPLESVGTQPSTVNAGGGG